MLRMLLFRAVEGSSAEVQLGGEHTTVNLHGLHDLQANLRPRSGIVIQPEFHVRIARVGRPARVERAL